MPRVREGLQPELGTHRQLHVGKGLPVCQGLPSPFQCMECGQRCKHQSLHGKERPHICQSSALSVYLQIHHGQRPYRCEECGKTFQHSSALSTHMRIHMETKPYECGKTFRKNSTQSAFENPCHQEPL